MQFRFFIFRWALKHISTLKCRKQTVTPYSGWILSCILCSLSSFKSFWSMSWPTDREESIIKKMFPCRDRHWQQNKTMLASYSPIQQSSCRRQSNKLSGIKKQKWYLWDLICFFNSNSWCNKTKLYFLSTAKGLSGQFKDLLKTFKANNTNSESCPTNWQENWNHKCNKTYTTWPLLAK